MKAAILSEDDLPPDPTLLFDGMFATGAALAGASVRAGRSARLRAHPDRTVEAIAEERGEDPLSTLYDLMLEHERDRDADVAALQLRRRQPRRDSRDDDASRRCAGAVRRRRALRDDLRRFVSHVPAHPLGARPSPRREAVAGVRHPQAVPRHRPAVRADRPWPSSAEKRPTST